MPLGDKQLAFPLPYLSTQIRKGNAAAADKHDAFQHVPAQSNHTKRGRHTQARTQARTQLTERERE